MRLTVILGMLSALLVGAVVIYVALNTLAGQPASVPTLAPATPTPAGIRQTPSPATSPSSSPTVRPSPSPTEVSVGTQVGQRAAQVLLPRLGGGEIDTYAGAGTPLWINFMATWCPECRDELPMMAYMQHQLGDQMDIVVVDIGEDEETVAAFMVSLGVELPVALDEDSSVQEEWGVLVLPVHFWLDGDGIIRDIVYGGAPREIFVEAVHGLVPDVDLSPP